jgi:ribonuclease HI
MATLMLMANSWCVDGTLEGDSSPSSDSGWRDLAVMSPPEWDVVRREVQAALAAHTSEPMQLAGCASIDVYTDGSAPLQNPGEPIGFAAIVLGFAAVQASGPAVRLDVGRYIPGRTADPPTTNNRAEIAGILTPLELLRTLPAAGPVMPTVTIWCDSNYTVQCGNGVWKRRKNMDLWAVYDEILGEVPSLRRGDSAALPPHPPGRATGTHSRPHSRAVDPARPRRAAGAAPSQPRSGGTMAPGRRRCGRATLRPARSIPPPGARFALV